MKYPNWRKEPHPIAALASNLTEQFVERGAMPFSEVVSHSFGATIDELVEAVALAHACRQIVPEAGKWRAATLADAGMQFNGGAIDDAPAEPDTSVETPVAKAAATAQHNDDPLAAGQNLRK